MNANPYLNPSAVTPPPPNPNPPRQQPFWKKALAFIAVGFGAILILSGITSGDFLFCLLAGLAIALPGIWWLVHENREKNGAAPMKRHWAIIAIASIVMLFASGAFLPERQGNTETAPATSSTSSTPPPPSSEAPTTSETPTETTSAAPTTESVEPTTSPTTTASAEPVSPRVDNESDDEDRPYVPPARQPAPIRQQPAPAPRPAPVAPQPAPAPQPAYEPPSTGAGTVHPGAYCSGGTGVSKTGKPMVCAPASDGRNRWQSAG
ncbi:hypothetical protein CAURIC_08265 [Corynebacterium auriscanis]|nr:hypothetical protein CAURIC_08265 [Corynebacterium auriscanis]